MDPTSYSKPVENWPPTAEQRRRNIKAQKAAARRRIKEELKWIAALTQQEQAL